MNSREGNLSSYIGEPGMKADLAILKQTQHVSEYYNKRMDRMRSLMNEPGVSRVEIEAYNLEIYRYTFLLHQMRHDGHLLNTGQVEIRDAGWIEWHQRNDM